MKTSRTTHVVFAIAMTVAIAVVWVNRSHANAPPGHYTIMDGTVFDTKTGLTWQQTTSLDKYNWSDAQTYCAALDLPGTGGFPA